MKTQPKTVAIPLTAPGLEYNQSNEQSVRKAIDLSFQNCQRRLTALEDVVGEEQPAVTAPVGGATIDAESRTAINAILAVLAAHGLTG